MRTVWITTGVGLSLSLVMLSISIFQSGEAAFLFRAARYLRGPAAYAIGVAYLALAFSLLAAFILGTDIGPKHWLRSIRNVSFFCFAVAFTLAAALGVHHALTGSAL